MLKLKKLMALCCAVALATTCSVSAFAAKPNNSASGSSKAVIVSAKKPEAIEDNGTQYHPKSTAPDVILSSSRIVPDSLNVPTRFYDLSQDSYFADLELVGPSWLYTNRYFKSNSNGVINVGYLFDSITGRDVRLVIGLYNMSTGRMETTFASGYGSHVSSSMHFYNLNKNTNYAIAFTCQDTSSTTTDQLTGNATIFH